MRWQSEMHARVFSLCMRTKKHRLDAKAIQKGRAPTSAGDARARSDGRTSLAACARGGQCQLPALARSPGSPAEVAHPFKLLTSPQTRPFD